MLFHFAQTGKLYNGIINLATPFWLLRDKHEIMLKQPEAPTLLAANASLNRRNSTSFGESFILSPNEVDYEALLHAKNWIFDDMLALPRIYRGYQFLILRVRDHVVLENNITHIAFAVYIGLVCLLRGPGDTSLD